MIRPPPEAFAPPAASLSRRRLEARPPSALVWVLTWAAAGLFTLGLHVGLYLLLTRQETPPSAPLMEPAAVMIDLAPQAVTAKSEVDNSLAGPEATPTEEAAPEMQEAPPPPAPDPVVDTPPPPPQVKPQAALPPKPPKQEVKKPDKKIEKKPVEKERPKKPVEKKDKPTVSTRAGGGPRSDRHTADVTAASAAGSAVSQASLASWQNEVRARIVRAKRFPPEARGQSYGAALVSVSFAANGSVSAARLISSSGNAALDAEAVAVMYRAAPYPPPLGGKALTQTIPINFNRR